MAFKFSARSLKNLEGVHPALRSVVENALKLSEQDFTVTEGVRTIERQQALYRSGKSKTMNSRHLKGHAVDLMPYGVPDVWNRDKPEVLDAWLKVRHAMFTAARKEGISLRWGGDFNGDGFEVGNDNWDLPHFELPASKYP